MADYKQVLKQQYEQVGSNPQAKGYFGILATLVLIIVLVLLIFPAVRHITQINKEITDARQVKTDLENKLLALEQAKTNLAAVESDLPLLDLALPVGSDMPRHFVRINQLADKHDLEIQNVQFTDVPLSRPSIKESELSTRDFIYTLTFEGSFPNFRNFVRDLENLIRISDVNIVSVVKEEDEPLSHTVGVASYFLGISLVSPEDIGSEQPEGAESIETIPGEAQP